jgi:carbon dioxide concentrating mechanism protein CcmL
MLLGVVSGEIYSTINHPTYDNHKLLIVDLTDAAWKPTGKYLIAMDATDAGVGQRVLINDEGNGARQILNDEKAPVRSVIVGIVDDVVSTE